MAIDPKAIAPLDIGAVESETGISKDTLRVWERRYGFPKPLRDANGERTYPLDQLVRLRSIRRLIDSGLRPGVVLRSSESELAELVDRFTRAVARALAAR